MSSVTQPRLGIAVGRVNVNGQWLEVETSPEYLRFFFDLLRRVGGPTGASTNDLTLSQFEDAGIPEIHADLYALRSELWTMPQPVQTVADDPLLPQDLREEVEALRARITALEQGTTP